MKQMQPNVYNANRRITNESNEIIYFSRLLNYIVKTRYCNHAENLSHINKAIIDLTINTRV